MSQVACFSLPIGNPNALPYVLVHVGKSTRRIEGYHIAYLQSEINYTRLCLNNGTSYLEAKTLKYFNKVLGNTEFVRIHQSYLVNVKQIVSISAAEVFLQNGLQLPISRRKGLLLRQNKAFVRHRA